MTSVVVCSAKGAPGVSTVACGLAAVWPTERPPVLAECDPSGGDLAVRFGLSGRMGVASFLFDGRDGGRPSIDGHCQRLPGGLEVMVGAAGADAGWAVDRELAQCGFFGAGPWFDGRDLIADCGRLLASAVGQQRLVTSCDVVLMATRPEAAALAQTRVALKAMRALRPSGPVFVVIVGPSSFGSSEIENVLEPDQLFELPDDPRAAGLLSGEPGRAGLLAKSALIKGIRKIALHITGLETARTLEPA